MDSFTKTVVVATVTTLLLLLVFLPLVHISPPPPGLFESMTLTAAFGLAAAALSLVPGLAAALALRRGGVWAVLAQVLYVPAVVPPTSVGVLLLASFSLPRLYCAEGVEALCCAASFVNEYIINRPLGVLIAMTVMALPVAFSVFDGALKEERAEIFFRSLGLSGPRLLLTLLLSLRTATVSAFIFAWIRSFSELGVLLIFASYPVTASIYIYQAWHIYGVGPAVGASLAVVALAVAAAYLARRWLSS
jgi:molybdate/tungstate transport system permease protein